MKSVTPDGPEDRGGEFVQSLATETLFREGPPMLREPALLASEAMDGEAQPAWSERRPGWPQRTSGDGAWVTPNRRERCPELRR